jgi:hypothetical protein
VRGIHMLERFDVEFWNHQQVYRRPWVDVMKGDEILVFVDFFTRNLALGDFAKDAVG